MSRVAVEPADASPPAGPSRRCCSWRSVLEPVEWNGRYSVDKLLCLLDASQHRALWILLLSPLPSLIELLPLNDPSLGWRSNGAFMARCGLRVVVSTVLIENQIAFYVPDLAMPRTRMLVMNSLQGVNMVGIFVAVSAVTQVFPVPFAVIAMAPLYVPFLKVLHWLFSSHSIGSHWDPATISRLNSDHARVTNIFSIEIVHVLVYAFFGTVFEQVPEQFQTIMLTGLVVLKAFVTRGIWRLAQINRDGVDDLAAAQVAFGPRVFHGLFTATCFQKSKSAWMLSAFVVLWIAYDVLAIREIHLQTQRVRRARRRCRPPACGRLECFVRRVSDQQVGSSQRPTWLVSSHQPYLTRAAEGRVCDECAKATSSTEPTAFDIEYLHAITKLFQQREATLLRLYVETFVPLVFFSFVAGIKYLPNGHYMPFFFTHNLHDLAWRLGITIAGKLASLVALLCVLNRGCREDEYPSGSRQLTFALSSLSVAVQGRMVATTLSTFEHVRHFPPPQRQRHELPLYMAAVDFKHLNFQE